MFGLSIVKTAELQNLKNTVVNLEDDVLTLCGDVSVLQRKYNNLADQVARSDKATRDQLTALAKPKTCPVLQQTYKHEADPVGAWESKQRVLEQRLAVTTKDLQDAERMVDHWRGRHFNLYLSWQHQRNLRQQCVHQLKKDIYDHQTRKPVIVQLPPSETAVFVRHKKYGTLGLLKGNHITILSKGNQLDVGDVILNATPAVVYEFWNIELLESVKLSV